MLLLFAIEWSIIFLHRFSDDKDHTNLVTSWAAFTWSNCVHPQIQERSNNVAECEGVLQILVTLGINVHNNVAYIIITKY